MTMMSCFKRRQFSRWNLANKMLKSVIYDKMAAHPQIHAEVLPNESISPHNSYEVHPSSSKKKTKLSRGRKSLFLLLKNRKKCHNCYDSQVSFWMQVTVHSQCFRYGGSALFKARLKVLDFFLLATNNSNKNRFYFYKKSTFWLGRIVEERKEK